MLNKDDDDDDGGDDNDDDDDGGNDNDDEDDGNGDGDDFVAVFCDVVYDDDVDDVGDDDGGDDDGGGGCIDCTENIWNKCTYLLNVQLLLFCYRLHWKKAREIKNTMELKWV